MTQRLNHMEVSPALFDKMAALSQATKQETSLDENLQHLVDMRVSMLNGCAFCLDMHAKEAKINGERELRLYHLAIWRESPLFSDKERAALAWAEKLTQVSQSEISDAFYQEIREVLSEQELSDLTYAVVSINAWNRLAVGFSMVPGAADAHFGLDKANLS